MLAAVFTARSRRRLRAVILPGVTGYGTAMLFVLHGAPDLALTQVLVETISLVVFVLVLRRLPAYFTDRPLSPRRYWRMALGVAVALGRRADHAGHDRLAYGEPRLRGLPEGGGGVRRGHNIVNVILVDIRAWDTLGEISVLVAAATGVASLVFLNARVSGIRRVHDIPYPERSRRCRPGRAAVWLPGPDAAAGPALDHLRGGRPTGVPHASWCSRSTCCSPGTTTPAAASLRAWSPDWRSWSATWPAAGTSSTRRRPSMPAPHGHRPVRGRGLRTGALAFGGAVLQSAVVDLRPPGARRGAPGHLGVLRRRGLPARRRAGARPAAQPWAPASTATSSATSATRRGREAHDRQPEPDPDAAALIGCGVYLILERSLTRVLVGWSCSATASTCCS